MPGRTSLQTQKNPLWGIFWNICPSQTQLAQPVFRTTNTTFKCKIGFDLFKIGRSTPSLSVSHTHTHFFQLRDWKRKTCFARLWLARLPHSSFQALMKGRVELNSFDQNGDDILWICSRTCKRQTVIYCLERSGTKHPGTEFTPYNSVRLPSFLPFRKLQLHIWIVSAALS